MGLIDYIFRKKKAFWKNSAILPSELKQFINEHITKNKEVMLIDTGVRMDGSIGSFISIILKDQDQAIEKIGKDPFVEIIPLLIKLHVAEITIYYLFMLVRFNGNQHLIYEVNFNLACQNTVNLLKKLTDQKIQQIIVVGDKKETVIRVDLTISCAQLAAAINLAVKQSDLNWNADAYATCLRLIYDKFSTQQLVEVFNEHGMVINLNLKLHNSMTEQNHDALAFHYDGGKVTRAKLEEALDFMILIETDPVTGAEEYEENLKKYQEEVKMARDAVRQYGEQILPRTLENMQKEFYSVTNSLKYRQSVVHCSVAYSMLNHVWHGIGPWQC